MKITFYLDLENQWRWQIKTHNDEVIATSHLSFPKKHDCINQARNLKGSLHIARVIDIE